MKKFIEVNLSEMVKHFKIFLRFFKTFMLQAKQRYDAKTINIGLCNALYTSNKT